MKSQPERIVSISPFPAGCRALVSDPLFPELNEVILRACQNELGKRYLTAEEMHADLTLVLNGGSVKRLRMLERRFARFKRASIPAAAVFPGIDAGVLSGLAASTNIERRFDNARSGPKLPTGFQAWTRDGCWTPCLHWWKPCGWTTGSTKPMDRARIGMIHRPVPKLLQMWTNSDQVVDGEFSGDGRLLLLTASFAERVSSLWRQRSLSARHLVHRTGWKLRVSVQTGHWF